MKPLALLAGALLCASAAASLAQQSVYRCGADGRSYSQEPCDSGQRIEVGDARSAEQSAQTRLAAQRDARLAQAMQREREHAEQQALRQPPAVIGGGAKPVAHGTGERCAAGSPPCAAKRKSRHGAAADITLYRAPQPR